MKNQQILVIIILSVLTGFLFSRPAAAKIRLSSGLRVNSFAEDLKETDGAQVLVPLEASYTQGQLTLLVRTSYAWTELTHPQQPSAELATLTDTLASVSYTIKGLPAALTGGVTVNLPTGREQLTDEEDRVTTGEFDLRQFGEGVNVGLNLSAVKTVGALTAGLNVAYTYRGEYTSSDAADAAALDPGDQVLLAGKLNWKAATPIKLGATAVYLHSTANQVADTDDFQSGATIILGQSVEYQPKPFEFSLTLQQTLPQKAKYAEEGKLRAEPDNGAGNTWTTAASIGYQYSKTLAFKLLGSVRLTEESPRQDTATGKPYAGRKVVYNIGPDIRYQINKALACQVNASYVVHAKEPSATISGDQTTTGFKLNTSVSYTF